MQNLKNQSESTGSTGKKKEKYNFVKHSNE